MKNIQLTKGYVAIVDDRFYDAIAQFRWCAEERDNGLLYAVRSKTIAPYTIAPVRMHTAVLEEAGVSYGHLVDHRNQNGLDNRLENLRPATVSQNRMNSRPQSRNSCGFKGVRFKTDKNKWVANITKDGRQRHLGYFESAEEAARAYDEAATELFGEFARLNCSLSARVEHGEQG